MQITELEVPGVFLITPKRFHDDRGFFTELYNAKALADAGFRDVFVQDNFSLSSKVGTIRGLHFQVPPYSQVKLVRAGRGLRDGVERGRWLGAFDTNLAVEAARAL